MHRVLTTCLTIAIAGSSLVGTARASSAGGAMYVVKPVRGSAPTTEGVKQASCHLPGCSPHAPCEGCKRLGFACVDGATPAPCTAEGGCYLARSTYGFTETRWRRWPGDTRDGRSPELAPEGEDSLLPAFDPPAPEEEDQQAPASIEDSAPVGEEESESQGPDVEITLPPLPELGPDRGIEPPRGPAPPQFRDGPPELPFGFNGAPAPRSASRVNATTTRGASSLTPTRLPAADRAGEDAPPPLPTDFTWTPPTAPMRRLPSISTPGPDLPRFDGLVRPVSAVAPATR